MPPSGTGKNTSFHSGLPTTPVENPVTSSQVSPPSVERNKACGETPAYHRPGSFALPGVSHEVKATLFPSSPSAALGNAGGRLASVQVFPPSLVRWMVGPR
jgi:hypothetical protein